MFGVQGCKGFEAISKVPLVMLISHSVITEASDRSYKRLREQNLRIQILTKYTCIFYALVAFHINVTTSSS